MSIETIKPGQFKAAADTLAAAFWDDPLMQVMAPDKGRRARVGPWYFSKVIDYGIRWGHVFCNEEASAVAAWLPPDHSEASTRNMPVGIGLPLRAGIYGAMRYMRAMSITEKLHMAVEGPHWYLMVLGTRPDQQAKGLGSELLDLATSEADLSRAPCYLETVTERNVAFYSKRGFEVAGRAQLFGFTMFGMVRLPKSS